MKQEFYDRYKRSLTKRLPETRSKKTTKNRNKRNPSLFQQWSRNLKNQQKSHSCCFPLSVASTIRKPLADVQVNTCSCPFPVIPVPLPHQVRSIENTALPTYDKENIHEYDEAPYFGESFSMPAKDVDSQLATPYGTSHTQFPSQYVQKEQICPENPNLLFEHPSIMTEIYCMESPPPYNPFYHNIANNVILDKNGKFYAQSSTVRECPDNWFPKNNALCPFKKSNARSVDMTVHDPLIDPDLGFTISESSLVVDMGHIAFYDVVSEQNYTDAQETEIAGKFLHIFQDVENLLRQEKQKRKENQKHYLKLFVDSETVFDGTEPWLDSSDLKNESFVNSLSALVTTKYSEANPIRNAFTET